MVRFKLREHRQILRLRFRKLAAENSRQGLSLPNMIAKHHRHLLDDATDKWSDMNDAILVPIPTVPLIILCC